VLMLAVVEVNAELVFASGRAVNCIYADDFFSVARSRRRLDLRRPKATHRPDRTVRSHSLVWSRYPPDDANPQTTGQRRPTEPRIRRSGNFRRWGDSSSIGQTNQNSTAAGTNQTRGTSMNPGTRPAGVFQLQQGNGINNQNWPVSPVQPQLSTE